MRSTRLRNSWTGLDSLFSFFLHFVILSRNYLGRNHTHQATEYFTTRTWTGPVFPFYHISFFFPTKRLGLNHSQANPTTHFPTLPATTTGPGTSISFFPPPISLPCPFSFLSFPSVKYPTISFPLPFPSLDLFSRQLDVRVHKGLEPKNGRPQHTSPTFSYLVQNLRHIIASSKNTRMSSRI
jgi:hypothetical protein